jgi:divalent metal cation (Fe/Co/Zn/Cd) transporter
MKMETTRAEWVRQGVSVERLTLLWMVIEMGVSIGAGIAARSILLIAFGLDSLIELVSGGILLWRLSVEEQGGDVEQVELAERRATRIVAFALGLLCVYVLLSAGYGLITRVKPEPSIAGIGISAAAILFMPYLAARKRRIAKRIQSEALEGDATSSITCAYMAGTVLLGLVLNTYLGWWWAEDAAALIFLVWLGRETWEALEEARRPGM